TLARTRNIVQPPNLPRKQGIEQERTVFDEFVIGQGIRPGLSIDILLYAVMRLDDLTPTLSCLAAFRRKRLDDAGASIGRQQLIRLQLPGRGARLGPTTGLSLALNDRLLRVGSRSNQHELQGIAEYRMIGSGDGGHSRSRFGERLRHGRGDRRHSTWRRRDSAP